MLLLVEKFIKLSEVRFILKNFYFIFMLLLLLLKFIYIKWKIKTIPKRKKNILFLL